MYSIVKHIKVEQQMGGALMYFYSKRSSSKIVHKQQCPYCEHMNCEVKEGFYTLEEARQEGYHLCKYCAPIGVYYRRELHKMKKYAAENGLIFNYSDGSILIQTPYSQWKIITNGRNDDIFLYHKNVFIKSYDKSLVPGYHSQAVRRRSIIAYMSYIVEHDRYRLRNPLYQKQTTNEPPKKGTKRYKKQKERRKRRERYASIMNVLALIDNGIEYREMKV
ncbi:MAG: hypothetical protein K2N37_02020 [Lachnospiraceae bacterium]|nr:hypothetical protein [Lachnospiraceae bacterium]